MQNLERGNDGKDTEGDDNRAERKVGVPPVERGLQSPVDRVAVELDAPRACPTQSSLEGCCEAAQKIDGPTSLPPELVEYALASAHAAVDSSTRLHHGRNSYSLLESSDSEE